MVTSAWVRERETDRQTNTPEDAHLTNGARGQGGLAPTYLKTARKIFPVPTLYISQQQNESFTRASVHIEILSIHLESVWLCMYKG